MNFKARIKYPLFHAVLIALSVVFSLPFLWMLSTSTKVDKEIVHDPMVWIPALPDRVRTSPYLDYEAHPPSWNKPPNFPKTGNWGEFCVRLREAIWKRASDLFKSTDWPLDKDDMEPLFFVQAQRDIQDAIWVSVHQRVPEGDWSGGSAVSRFVDKIVLEDVEKAWQGLYRYVAMGEVHLRNTSAMDIGLAPQPEKSRIHYAFQADGQPVELAKVEIRLASPAEKLDQIMVRLKGDASYHRLSARFEFQGKVYRSVAPALLTLGEFQDFFWTFAAQKKYEIDHLTFVEDPSAKTDVPEGSARITLSLSPTPYWRALWERVTRNYREVFRWVPYGTYTWVTIKITFINIIGQILACSLVGFAFARLSFPGRDFLFILMLGTMMLPPQVTMIPQFVLFSKLGMYNTLFPLTILSFTGAPFFIFLVRQFYMSIPQDLTDAAKIDGCGYFTIYWRIMLPLIKPALAAIAIFQFQDSWNEFLQPLIYITDEGKTPISLGLFMFRQAQRGQWAELMAGASMMTLPIIVLFFFAQRYFIQGVTLTGLKG
jgi:multiple sugar transport system permease protein